MTPQAIVAAVLSRANLSLTARKKPQINGGADIALEIGKLLPDLPARNILGAIDEISRLLVEAGIAAAKSEKSAAKAEQADAALDEHYPGLGIPLRDLKYLHNSEAPRRSLLYFEAKDTIIPAAASGVTDTIKTAIGQTAYAAWRKGNQLTCRMIYRPDAPRLLVRREGLSEFNTWRPAPWSVDWTPTTGASCPAEVDEYLAASFGDAETVAAVKSWLRDATFSRAFPIMVLTGVPGSGKNTFVEALAAPLVGDDNYKTAQRGFKDSRFQSAITACRLFFFDEQAVDASSREILKAYHNRKSTFEYKGEDVGGSEEIHASIVVANNHPINIKLEFSDRKFYVPRLSLVPLRDSIGDDKVASLYDLTADRDFVRQFASYLHENFKPNASKSFPKTALFKAICVNSYPAAFREFVKLCRTSEQVTSRLMKRGKGAFSSSELQEQIDHYEANFGEKLATVDGIGTNWVATSHICEEVRRL